MAQYTARPVNVTALRITGIQRYRSGIGIALALEDGTLVHPDAGMLARMTPEVGDYWVTQEDGYIYLNPKAVFERKYEPAFDMSALQKLRELGQ